MIISQTPLRISLCGGGTDFTDYYMQNEGYILSTCIDKYIYVIIKERFDDYIYVNSSKKEIVRTVDEIEHELVREAARKAQLPVGVEITMLADIPSTGSGLGSSSSLIIGLLNAFYHYRGIQVTSEQLAKEACEIEIDILKKPIGKQDQYIAAFGGIQILHFKKDDTVEVRPFELSSERKRRLGSNLLLFFTNVTRTAGSILSEQKENISEKMDFLNKIKELTFKAERSLTEGNIDVIGKLLNENWELKKNLASNISNADIDNMYNAAIAGGATGGKIAGAGGGGFLMLYCKRDKQDKLREALKAYREMPFLLEPHGSKIIFNYRRYDWK
jgi:D-glycero-alpha-D-manno-heptose-7-phosphate kinase